MNNYEGVFDGQTIYKNNDEIIERNKINSIINKLNSENDYNELRNIYTDVLLDENVIELITEISFSKVFVRDFPEFYVKNKYGEDVINCTQNNKYHRYGVFKHILVSVEEVGKNSISLTDHAMKILKWTMLLHDIGKPLVKQTNENGNDSFHDHEIVSCEIAEKILDRFLFDIKDKRLILTLIKYHDRYLNEGELIYENFKKLAEELLNDKESFKMLIEVKLADSIAKNIQVYEKFKISKRKYMEFMETYFDAENKIVIEEQVKEIVPNQEFSEMKYNVIFDNMVEGNNIRYDYQPIIDIEKNKVEGYEILARVKNNELINIGEFLKFAREKDDFSRLDQMLFVNAMENFDEIKVRESDVCFINMSVEAYEEYINKPRIYDYFKKYKLVVEFTNYEYYPSSILQKTINKIYEENGKVSLNAFGSNAYKIEDLNFIKLSYLKLDKNICNDILNDENKVKYVSQLINMCDSRDIKLVALGIESKEVFDKLKSLGIRYMQGNYLVPPKSEIELLNNSLTNIVENGANESIV